MFSLLKPVFFIACFFLFCFNANAQQASPDILQFYKKADSLMSRRFKNTLPATKSVPFTQPSYFKRQSLRLPAVSKSNILPQKIITNSVDKPTGTACNDTSARLVYRKDSLWFANDYLTKTRDGNILIPGFELNVLKNQIDAHLLKVTQQGDTLWSKLMQVGYNKQFNDLYKAFELNDGSLLLVGDINVPMPQNGRSDFMMMRLTSTGDLIWEKTFKTKLWDRDTTAGSIEIFDCREDANGNLFLGGNVRALLTSRIALAFKIDLSGNMLWSRGFAFQGDAAITGINIVNQKVTFFGWTLTGTAINCFGIASNANTGDTLSSKYLVSANPGFWHAIFEDNMVHLNNGNLMLYGRGISDGATFDPSQLPIHCGMIEVTPELDFVRGYLFRSSPADPSYNSRISVFEDGSAAYTRLEYLSPFSANCLFGNFKNGQILKERVIPYNVGISWVSNFIQMDDGGQLITTFFGDSATQISAMEFMRLHNSDTSGSCLGKDTLATIVQPETFYSSPYYLDSVSVNVLTENIRPFNGVFNNNFIIGSNCKQVNFCDSLKLVASRDTLCENVPVNIIIRKNKECGAYPLWNYDTTTVSSFYKLNDSTVQVTFDKPWEGFIHATIEGCKTLDDSVKLTVLLAPTKLDIGPDTVICPGNVILLNAKKGYATYKWQDGSGDSTFDVTQPGKYYVTTSDACGGIYHDTVVVVSHAPIPFDIGPDTSICKNDTINITAPSGFIHYQWTQYNISSDTDESVRIYPLINFMYKVVAEKTQGCFASDSFYVTVKNVPAINLGNDTSFCINQSVLLDAGSGFDKYEWNTGELSEKVTVNHQGTFAVKATSNGCAAYDTLKVISVYPLPLFSLGNDTVLCDGQQLQYNFNLQQATYNWSTGNISGTQIIYQAGTYWLQVTQMGCVNSDTVNVIYNPSPVVKLGNDTTLCEKQTLLLDAYNNNAGYLWQDGSTARDYMVKNAGEYFVTVKLANCSSSDTIAVTYKALPFFTLGKDSFLCTGQQYILKPAMNTNADLLWQDRSSAPSFTILKEGIYFLTASNECGSYTDSVTITSGFCNIIMPNAFTPNDDGINDIFKVKYPFPVKQFNMAIYDRWGKKVFETNNINEGWDGNNKGVPHLQNSYTWIINFTDINNKQQQLKGVVTLLR
jgi:gliding motility-associated-like protein